MDSQTPDQSSGEPGPARGSPPPPPIRAEALHGLVRAHRAAAPLDPGLGAPWEAGWKWPPWGTPAPLRGPRRFRSSWSGRESRDAPPALYVAGSRGVDTMGFLEPLFQLLWAGTLCAKPALCPDCPPGAMPFRDLQCALYNGHPVLGPQKTYQWVPFYGAPNQCDLNCLAVGHAFYHSFGRVLDGTPCSWGSRGLCVAGRCLNAGCDGLMGSDAREDHCGRCGGTNDSCLFVQRVFRDTGAFAGYWNVTLIPEGARHIYAAHRSRNHLALMGGDGRYVLNGNGEVSPSGMYEAAGTRVVYTRAAGPEETLRAAGPTSQDLLLQIPAHPVPTPAVAPTGCSTIAAVTLCSGLECWATSARPRRPAMRCVCSLSTRTARHCSPSSMCGHLAAAPAHQWPSIESTCWLPSALSTPMALRTGCCCPTLAMPGPGAPPRTAEYAWLPDTALSEPPDQKDVPDQAQTQPISSLAWLPRNSELSPTTAMYLSLIHIYTPLRTVSQIHSHSRQALMRKH
ncbi:ADAMTS-like protein 5 isoform X2 [Myotis daubentonii]|uniref:ADAMTS-like protein 5 isoform X2 n=1 Tax=Myotis daubentonii TaxID=98922 RepID=UPI002873359F|nr:ADAMTS-like protein 5 isoform X2 [Myotis daubentonii]